MQLGSSRDRCDPWALCQEPSKRDLRRGQTLLRCDRTEKVDQCLIGLQRLRPEARHDALEISLAEGRVLIDFAGEEPLAEWAERDKANAQFLERRQNLLFWLTPPQRVFALQGGDRLEGVSVADRGDARLRQAEVPHLSGPNELLHRARDVLDRHLGVDTVLVEQIDCFGAQALQCLVGDLPDALRPTVDWLGRVTVLETELGGDTTRSRIGASASPTTSSLMNGP
jgi:hypothetical protein